MTRRADFLRFFSGSDSCWSEASFVADSIGSSISGKSIF
jgi:hypothetical protein